MTPNKRDRAGVRPVRETNLRNYAVGRFPKDFYSVRCDLRQLQYPQQALCEHVIDGSG